MCQQSILPPAKINSLSDAIVTVMAHTTAHVGNQLLHGEATIVPDVHDSFHKSATDLIHMRDLQGDDMKHIVTSRWILSNLKVSLKHHVAYSCRVRKYGTLIYRPHTSLIPSLAQALWEVRMLKGNKSCRFKDAPVEANNIDNF